MTMDVKGMDVAMAMMATLKKIGGQANSIELHGKQREEGGINNAEVLDSLAEQGRDFITPDAELIKEISKKMVKIIEKGLNKYKGLARLKGHSGIDKKKGFINKKASQIQASALRGGAKVWLDNASKNIEESDYPGEAVDELTPAYARYKQKTYGFTRPIGKATGQVLDNVSPSSRNLKLKR